MRSVRRAFWDEPSAVTRTVQVVVISGEADAFWGCIGRASTSVALTVTVGLVQTIRHGMRKIQYRPHLIDGCLAGTGLSLTATTS